MLTLGLYLSRRAGRWRFARLAARQQIYARRSRPLRLSPAGRLGAKEGSDLSLPR